MLITVPGSGKGQMTQADHGSTCSESHEWHWLRLLLELLEQSGSCSSGFAKLVGCEPGAAAVCATGRKAAQQRSQRRGVKPVQGKAKPGLVFCSVIKSI